MNVTLLSYTQNATNLCATAAKACYSAKEIATLWAEVDDKSSVATIAKTVGMGHQSVIEHATYTFALDAVSRSLTHQLVRHRIASFSQQSQRYVNLEKPSYVIPEEIRNDRDMVEIFEKCMLTCWDSYNVLVRTGAKNEDARGCLPNACTTNIVVSMNARELMHFFTLRTCNRAQTEIREVAKLMLAECKRVSPEIFAVAGPACFRGVCPEGKLSCKREI